MKKTIAVIGAGSWGTALAMTLAHNGHTVKLTTRSREHIQQMRETRRNERYLPGIRLEDGIQVVDTDYEAIEGADMVVFAAPAQHFRDAFVHAVSAIDDGTIIVNVAKGIERGTLMTLSQVAHILRRDLPYVTLSGPSHAEEVCRFMPTTVVAASRDQEAARAVQDVFMSERFRVYTSSDVIGVELGGALKNIIALGAGVSDGIGFGDNAKAALMTRGITEMTRLGVAMGAKPSTFAGLSGVGDLIVTCTSMHSRNRRCGILMGQGKSPEEAQKEVGMVVEGITTCEAAFKLRRTKHVEMPSTECIYRCIKGEIGPEEAVSLLMTREKKDEVQPDLDFGEVHG